MLHYRYMDQFSVADNIPVINIRESFKYMPQQNVSFTNHIQNMCILGIMLHITSALMKCVLSQVFLETKVSQVQIATDTKRYTIAMWYNVCFYLCCKSHLITKSNLLVWTGIALFTFVASCPQNVNINTLPAHQKEYKALMVY